jgi:hypothetical protein
MCFYCPHPVCPHRAFARRTARSVKAVLRLAAWAVIALTVRTAPGGEYFPYLYQRTMYTDNLTMTGAWWANPALISFIDAPFMHTANVLPLGDSLLVSSFRVFIPLAEDITVGAGILGAGAYTTGSSKSYAEESSFSHQSSFAFTRPRFQAGAAAQVPYAGRFGIIGTIGADLKSYGSGSAWSASPGAGLGWLSPLVLQTVEFSAAAMFIHHDLDVAFWEKTGKLGFRFTALDSVLNGSFEFSFTPGEGFGVFTPRRAEYEVLKALVSAQVFNNLALMAGFSTDLDYYYRNNSCVHLGAELREMPEFPVLGGYDIGFRFGRQWLIIHRIWVGLNFRKLLMLRPPL